MRKTLSRVLGGARQGLDKWVVLTGGRGAPGGGRTRGSGAALQGLSSWASGGGSGHERISLPRASCQGWVRVPSFLHPRVSGLWNPEEGRDNPGGEPPADLQAWPTRAHGNTCTHPRHSQRVHTGTHAPALPRPSHDLFQSHFSDFPAEESSWSLNIPSSGS